MTPTKIIMKGKSKKAVAEVGGELERKHDWCGARAGGTNTLKMLHF